jgi:tyrosine-protein phosphatase YwqE
MGIIRRYRETLPDFSLVGTDIHNHVIPGIDDGSPTLEESMRMLRLWAQLGFRKVVTTPHVISAAYPNTRDTILGQMYLLQDRIAEEGIGIELEATGEYHIDYEFIDKLKRGELIGIGTRRVVLLELPFHQMLFSVEEVLREVREAGYAPVIAHPERYFYLMGRMRLYEELKEMGVWFQLNLGSLLGQYGLPVKITARRLIDAGLVDMVGSDAHHAGHLENLRNVLSDKYFIKLMKSRVLLNREL